MAAIEPATSTHSAVLAAIHAAAFPPADAWGSKAIALQLELPGAFGLLHMRGGMLLGRVAADDAEVLTLAVVPAARRARVATDLLRAAMIRAGDLGAMALFLEVATGNTAARALYEGAGFVVVGNRRRYYADGSDAVVMRKNLF